MATNCTSCNDLRENAPDFVTNGVTSAVCTSMKNDTGLNPSLSPKHTDCADLEDVNDCLIGNLEDAIEAYDICDWKDFMRTMIPNLYNTIKLMICALCGVWTNIHNLWTKTEELECKINYIAKGAQFAFGEETTGKASYLVAGQGVSYKARSSTDAGSSDVELTYIGGGLGRIKGSLLLFTNSFTDADGTSRSGNSVWGSTGAMEPGGELLYEIRVKNSEYPQIASFFDGFGQETGGAAYHTRVYVVGEGKYTHGQTGSCYPNSGDPVTSGSDRGHLVPDGWKYIQVRMTCIISPLNFTSHTYNGTTYANSAAYSPYNFMGIRMNPSEIDC